MRLVPFALLAFAFCCSAGAGDPPNIVLILVDDMGYGDASAFNAASKISTPNIDSLARDGMRLTDAHASGPLCHMSRYGLMTGRYPFRTDVNKWPTQALIEPNQTTVADVAKRQGYRTAMVGKWHVGFDEDGYDKPLPGGPVDCGFDSYFGIRASTDIPPYFYIRDDLAVAPPTDPIGDNASEGWSPIQGEFWRSGGIAPNLKLHDVLPRFTDEAIDVIDSHAKSVHDGDAGPLFLYLAYPAPHTPWLPSEEFVGKSGAGMYGDFLMMVDANIGRVLNSLETGGMSDDTLVIFTSDNGPVWYPDDISRFGHDSVGGLRGMKADAWEGGHRMPMIVRWPGVVQPGTSCDQTISFVDVLATVASISGATLGDDEGPDSFDFSPLLHGQDEPVRRSLALQSGRGTMTIRSGPWKLIFGLGSGGFTPPSRTKPKSGEPAGQLYHLGNDRGEQSNLYDQMPEKVAELTRLRDSIVNKSASRP